jgi:hypothetical protein
MPQWVRQPDKQTFMDSVHLGDGENHRCAQSNMKSMSLQAKHVTMPPNRSADSFIHSRAPLSVPPDKRIRIRPVTIHWAHNRWTALLNWTGGLQP